MFDTSLLFHNAETLNASGNSDGVFIGKTGHAGVWVEIVVTDAAGTDPTVDFIVQESDDDANYNDLVTFEQITGTGRWARRVQSKKAYLRLSRTVGGTAPSFTTTAGIVTGPQRDAAA